MSDRLLSEVLEAFLVIRGLVVQKTKLINDCNRLLKDLLDSLLVESTENKRQFIRACISGLQKHVKEKKRRTSLVRAHSIFYYYKLFGYCAYSLMIATLNILCILPISECMVY
jgi:hypothetical protein